MTGKTLIIFANNPNAITKFRTLMLNNEKQVENNFIFSNSTTYQS
ncbi:protein of unknown function [Candidatus Nitrosocosmicus franklandus]|uniref:Uncharacterized protein n=1 Tax=Candidatus Nitrosocosmicus franklandianus TaxID=1798806 RepID=A0A484I8P8_9ARCH|nr:protein of unknown function [Candidatus Nitrosocosmicus franklandus]